MRACGTRARRGARVGLTAMALRFNPPPDWPLPQGYFQPPDWQYFQLYGSQAIQSTYVSPG